MSKLVTLEQIEQRRDTIYRRTSARRIRTLARAGQFIDAVGFALLFASTQNIELPSLFEAVKGRRDAHIDEWDADSDRVWVWKSDLPATRRAFYGKLLAGGKPAFVSLTMLPALFALHAPDDLARVYARGDLSRDAKRIADALAAMGPTPTMALSAGAGVSRADFHRALDELQKRLMVAPIGAVHERGAWVSQIFELTTRWFAREARQAQKLDADAARRIIAQRYAATVYACDAPMLARVFGWSRETARATLDELRARGQVTPRGQWMISKTR